MFPDSSPEKGSAPNKACVSNKQVIPPSRKTYARVALEPDFREPKKHIVLLREAERAFSGWKHLGFVPVGSCIAFSLPLAYTFR